MKSQVMSNIVRMLENEGPFKDVIYVILENVSKYLKMPDVTVMQYDEERTCLYPVLSYGGRHPSDTSCRSAGGSGTDCAAGNCRAAGKSGGR